MIPKNTIRAILVSSALSIGLISSGSVLAQDAMMQDAPSTALTSADFDGAELDSFVEAYVEVNMIGQAFAPQMQSAATPEEQMQVQTEASEQMMGAIENVEGINLERYNEIMAVAQNDTDLATRINTRLEAAATAQ
ncbi:hypothetical protein C4375_15325 [Devosia sp. I507]|nr:hypothetical protein C4375_15325 [Devosia sp. I507]